MTSVGIFDFFGPLPSFTLGLSLGLGFQTQIAIPKPESRAEPVSSAGNSYPKATKDNPWHLARQLQSQCTTTSDHLAFGFTLEVPSLSNIDPYQGDMMFVFNHKGPQTATNTRKHHTKSKRDAYETMFCHSRWPKQTYRGQTKLQSEKPVYTRMNHKQYAEGPASVLLATTHAPKWRGNVLTARPVAGKNMQTRYLKNKTKKHK